VKLFKSKDEMILIGEDQTGSLVQWPIKPLGYAKRTPYRGLRRDLTEIDPRTAARTGWPGCPRGPIPRRGKTA